jgi:hypothetical protein
MGPIAVTVYIQRQPSNLEAFGLAGPRDRDERQMKYEPVWDWNANALRWRDSAGRLFAKQDLIETVMSTLMDRHRV